MRKTISGITVILLLMSIGMVASVRAVVNDYDINIEIIPSTVPQGGMVTFRIHADLIAASGGPLPPDSYLDYVSVQSPVGPVGIFFNYPDGTSGHYRNDLGPIVIYNGVPDEASDYVDLTFGTNAPGKNDWEPPSTTDLVGLYTVWFKGFLYMTDGSDHWFDIRREFTVTPAVVIEVNDYITLIFPPGTEGVDATATETTRYPPLPPPPCMHAPQEEVVIATSETLPSDGFIGPVWEIEVTGTFSGLVRVRIYHPAESYPTEILQNDIVLGDVNADGKVDRKDLCIIIRALGSIPGGPRWNPYCDLNGDNKINLRDLRIAIRHLGQTSEWTPLSNTFVNSEEHYIEGDTDHFSVFGVR